MFKIQVQKAAYIFQSPVNLVVKFTVYVVYQVVDEVVHELRARLRHVHLPRLPTRLVHNAL